jgi:hypothetical protein
MKKLLVLSVALLTISMAKAQFAPFKVDMAFGAAIPSGSGSKGGVLFALEPKFAPMRQLAIGLRLEAALTARGFVASDGSSASADVAAVASYLVTGDYYLPCLIFRPFIGAGTGVFSLASATFSGNGSGGNSGTAASTKFGGMVRAGFELGHFRMAVEYNLVGNTSETVTEQGGNQTITVSSKNSYLGAKIGFFFGGGRR